MMKRRRQQPCKLFAPPPSIGFLLLLLSLLIVLSASLTYDNNPDDLSEVPTRHTLNKKQTKVVLDDLPLGDYSAPQAAEQVLDRIGSSLQDRLTKLFERTKTAECRAKIAEHLGYFVHAMGLERSLPFHNVEFTNECSSPPAYDFDNPNPNVHLGMIQNKTYQPSRDDNTAIYKQPYELQFVYGIMTHQYADETIRLIEALHEPGHSFVIHVDGKEGSDETHEILTQYAQSNKHYHIHIVDHPHRVRVNWGGFSMVNATLQMLHYTFENHLRFDKWIHLASTNYPIASNAKIRQTIAQYPVDANLLHIVLKPSRPKQASWHYFVECDDAVHRIYRLPPLTNATHGAELYTSSQWFTLSREFAHYLAYPSPQTFVYEFLQYAQHVVVADEAFFGTALLHSPFCDKHHNWNFVHLQFDQWENEVPLEQRDPKKCIMPDPLHCGRSPTTVTMDYVDLLMLSDDLWARKFSDQVDAQVKDVLDQHRLQQQRLYEEAAASNPTEKFIRIEMLDKVNMAFEGHGVLIVAKATVNSPMPLCLGLGETSNYVKLVPCFYDGVPETLAKDWETGAVVLEETVPHNRWNMGPCTQDGTLERLYSGEMTMTPGDYIPTGPRCTLTQVDGIRHGRCLDAHSSGIEPGGKARVFPCVKRWPQYVSFGNGDLAPKGSMHINVPEHIVRRIRASRPDDPPQESFLCLGVLWRGDKDEEHLVRLDEEETDDVDGDIQEEEIEYTPDDYDEHGTLKLDHYKGDDIVATQCSNVDAVIEWVFVPFIEEDEAGTLQDDSTMAGNEPSVTGPPPTCSADEPPCLEGWDCGFRSQPETNRVI